VQALPHGRCSLSAQRPDGPSSVAKIGKGLFEVKADFPRRRS
jgi:hypothetical protein